VDETFGDLQRVPTVLVGFTHEQTLYHSGNISQVENVMELFRCWRKLRVKHDTLENFINCNDKVLTHIFDLHIELLEVI